MFKKKFLFLFEAPVRKKLAFVFQSWEEKKHKKANVYLFHKMILAALPTIQFNQKIKS